MTTQHPEIDDVDVMLLHDGEVDKVSAERASVAVGSDPELAAKMDALGELGELVRGSVELDADDAALDGDALWSAIERRLEANGQPAHNPVSPQQETPAPSLAVRFAKWFESYRAHMVTGVVCAAAATLVVLAVRGKAGPTAAGNPAVTVPPPSRVEVGAKPPVALTSEPIEIESLEVYQGSGTIINLPGEDGEASTPVIWLSNEDSEETMEGPI